MIKVDDVENSAPITEICVVVSRDENGNEGICALNGMPLMCGYGKNVEKITAIAEHLKGKTSKKIILKTFVLVGDGREL